MTFQDLSVGQCAYIDKIDTCDKKYRKKLLALGLTKNTKVTLINKAPLGDPIQIKIHDSLIALRLKEAKCVVLTGNP